MTEPLSRLILAEADPLNISSGIHPAWGWLAAAVFTGLFAWLCIKQARYLILEEAWPWWLGGAVLALISIYGLISFIGSLFAGVALGTLLVVGFLAWLFMSDS